MVPSIEPPPIETPRTADNVEVIITGLRVEGTLPLSLSGRLLGIGPNPEGGDPSNARTPHANDGMVHSLHLQEGRAISYRSRRVITDTDADAHRLELNPSPRPRNNGPHLVAFGSSILALGDGSLAYEMTSDLDTLRRVDLAGQSRAIASNLKRDPVTGDLHVLAVDASGATAHVVVSSGALTRTRHDLTGPHAPISDLAISRDGIVFAADGFVGFGTRCSDSHVTWIATELNAPNLLSAHDVENTIVVYTLTPALERWALHPASATVHREILDPRPQKFAETSRQSGGQSSSQYAYDIPRFLWTTTDFGINKHDLITMSTAHHFFERGQPGDLVFIADSARSSHADGGWLVGIVHETAADETEVVILDAADITSPPVANIVIPRHIPRGLHVVWIPSTTP
jgi:carotenoid cleavage dioxygenase-like enzyme